MTTRFAEGAAERLRVSCIAKSCSAASQKLLQLGPTFGAELAVGESHKLGGV